MIVADLSSGCKVTTCPIWQWDKGQVLEITDIDLPNTFLVDISNTETSGDAESYLGQTGRRGFVDALHSYALRASRRDSRRNILASVPDIPFVILNLGIVRDSFLGFFHSVVESLQILSDQTLLFRGGFYLALRMASLLHRDLDDPVC